MDAGQTAAKNLSIAILAGVHAMKVQKESLNVQSLLAAAKYVKLLTV
jgi:hypothetical protein